MGGYSQLPVTPYRPEQGPNPLELLAGIQGLRNQQAQGQALALENQQRQIQMKNQQALTSAYQKWDGKDYNDLAKLALNEGATGDTVQALQQHALTIRKTASDIAKQDADTGSTLLQTRLKNNDLVAGAIGNVLNASDDEMPQKLLETANQLAQQKLIDPQHMQLAQSLAQQGPDAIKKALPMFQKDYMAQSAQLDQAAKEAEAAKNKAQAGEAASATAKNNAEMAFYQQNGGAPGVPLDQREAQAWLTANPGKSLADFMKYKATLVPQFNFNLQNAGTTGNAAQVAQRFGMSPVAFDQAAEKYWTSGQLPPTGRGGPALALNKALMNRAAELHPEGSLAANSAEYKANEKSLDNIQKQFDAVSAFENTANKNIDILKQTLKDIPDLGARFANVPARALSDKMLGSTEMAKFHTALATVQTEAAKILNSSNASGVLSDSARHELQDIIDANKPVPAILGSLQILQQDFGNRHESYSQQIDDIKRRMGGNGSQAQQSSAAPSQGKEIHYKIVNGQLVAQ